jgi:hypothetical protein
MELPSFRGKFFLSFAGENRQFASHVRDSLSQQWGLSFEKDDIFFDESLAVSTPIEEIYERVKHYAAGIVILDEHYLRKEAPRREAEEFKKGKKMIIVVLYGNEGDQLLKELEKLVGSIQNVIVKRSEENDLYFAQRIAQVIWFLLL